MYKSISRSPSTREPPNRYLNEFGIVLKRVTRNYCPLLNNKNRYHLLVLPFTLALEDLQKNSTDTFEVMQIIAKDFT